MPPPDPISHSPTLPRLSPADHALFNFFAAAHLDIHALADKSGRDLAELTAWAAAPEIRLYSEAYREIAGHALLNATTSALLDSIRLTSDPIEKRRAATALLRALTTPPRRGGTSPDNPPLRAASSSSHPTTTNPRPPTSPTSAPAITRQTHPPAEQPNANAAPTPTTPRAAPTNPQNNPSPTALLDSLESLRGRQAFPGREARSGISRLTAAAGLAGPAP